MAEREKLLEIVANALSEYLSKPISEGTEPQDFITDYLLKNGVSIPRVEVEPVVTCKDCKYNGLHTCPIAYIEKQTLQFVNYDPDFWCAKGELKKDGEK